MDDGFKSGQNILKGSVVGMIMAPDPDGAQLGSRTYTLIYDTPATITTSCSRRTKTAPHFTILILTN